MNRTAYINLEHTLGVLLNGKQKKQLNNYETSREKERDADPHIREEVCQDHKTSEGAVNRILREFKGRIVEETFDETFPLTA